MVRVRRSLVGRVHGGGRMRMWIPSPPQRVIGPAAYYPLEGGGVMKEPPPSLIVAGLSRRGKTEEVDALIMDDPVLPDNNSSPFLENPVLKPS